MIALVVVLLLTPLAVTGYYLEIQNERLRSLLADLNEDAS